MTLVFIGLLSKSNTRLNSLKTIKLEVAKYCVFVLLKPALDAKNSLNFLNCSPDHVKKILCSKHSAKSSQLTALGLNKYDNKNIADGQILSFSRIGPISSPYLSMIPSLYIVKAIVHTGLEWHLYTNMQARQVSRILHVIKKNDSCFLLCRATYFDRLINYSGNYLSMLNINLKSVKCVACQYPDCTICLNGTHCIIVNRYRYLCEPSKAAIADLVLKVKHKLYHKNTKGYWRANAYICPSEALLSIEKVLQLWVKYYSSMLSNLQMLTINQMIDYIFYKWQVK